MARKMQAAVVEQFGKPLVFRELDIPSFGAGQILVKTEACGVCHTDLHAAHGDWPVKPTLPFTPGHEGIGLVAAVGSGVTIVKEGDRVGVPWLYSACGHCEYCLAAWETVCAEAHRHRRPCPAGPLRALRGRPTRQHHGGDGLDRVRCRRSGDDHAVAVVPPRTGHAAGLADRGQGGAENRRNGYGIRSWCAWPNPARRGPCADRGRSRLRRPQALPGAERGTVVRLRHPLSRLHRCHCHRCLVSRSRRFRCRLRSRANPARCRGHRPGVSGRHRGLLAEFGGYTRNGGFAEYIIADPNYVAHVPAGLRAKDAAPIICAGITTYKGIKETEARPGEWIVISGAGGLGHLAIQYAKVMGLQVCAVDIDDGKLAHAKRLGADLVINAKAGDPAARGEEGDRRRGSWRADYCALAQRIQAGYWHDP